MEACRCRGVCLRLFTRVARVADLEPCGLMVVRAHVGQQCDVVLW